ncbi:Protein YhgF [Apilactobacillus kunkeei]|uniref:Tex family protein n=1 Tax=Apilactobacillus kunkeei TaxID=148814 RepID=UPI00200A6EB8|nr:Tex family protein [Apilactobacillus kunkeei]MCK8634028.1 RNA-binding transcriptional accessory protein [Apilactobacillus kunkeei]CAI2569310.1 Protein YhgF [Apilactobacillus kunkeei]CAI2569731.1 Protein YhgF [Apilactobacillus kunkeei]CAI2569904.1 Protein YhgF [Apilactobacillus kunkeei]CAI2569983.1 Protein YhgF [Apilactobacillus kunkeei]
MDQSIIKKIRKELGSYSEKQISAVISMLEDGNTVPFIARYRKERTGSLDEVQIREIADANTKITNLENRKEEVLRLIEEQGKLTDKLKADIQKAESMQSVEDLYLPYKKKKKTKAMIAREQGLEPLAKLVLANDDSFVNKAKDYVDAEKELNDVEDVLKGVHEIIAENIGNDAHLREWIRENTKKNGQIASKAKKDADEKDEKHVYEDYYDFSQPINQLKKHRVLALNRGEKEKVLTVSIDVNTNVIYKFLQAEINRNRNGKSAEFVKDAYEDAYSRFMKPAIEREIRNELTDEADEHAINVFGRNLYNLLMQAPIKGKIVIGFDPAYRTGCKLAAIDDNGKFLDKLVIYPHKPASDAKRQQAKKQLIDFIKKNHAEMIAIGNGTASRESEQFVSELIKENNLPVYYVIVNEAGASVYSASQNARDEFPDFHVEERSAVSIGRRLQDPLAELIKIDPKSVGVGQYQHDLPAKQLDAQLDRVVETAVNKVGVNVNTASPELLTRISGMTKTTAKNVVKFRNENGEYKTRQSLSKVPRLGQKTYEQAIGFLRILDGSNPLDNTDIHPESYKIANQIVDELNLNLDSLGTTEINQALSTFDVDKFINENAYGKQTVLDIIDGLKRPGRDFRDDMPTPVLKQDVLKIEDLREGMQLQGTVRNVIDFGAFVDVGVKQDGLVHISQMSNQFISDPSSVVSVGDIVDVWVLSVDIKRNRIQLTMINPEK